MGVGTRDYMKRPLDPPRLANTSEVPTWGAMADALRLRLMEIIENAPVQSIQEVVMLVDAAVSLQALHGRGQVYDKSEWQAKPHNDD